MVSLRFLLPFSGPPSRPHKPSSSSPKAMTTAAATFGVGMGLAAISLQMMAATQPEPPFHSKSWTNPSLVWASLSLAAEGAASTLVEPKTGTAFPTVLDGARGLLGVGVRKKSVFGLKNIDVYAFGVYADQNDLKRLKEKYATHSISKLKGSKDLCADILDQDLRMTIRIQIVYGRLSIRSVRAAFEESVQSRLQKFSGLDNKELLQRFTSLFKDEYKLPRGSIIDLSREQGHILHTRIAEKEVGSIQSKLLCQSILDLYIGEDPFDKRAKEDIELGFISALEN